ncbi:MAG: hypothetical protein LH702_15210 [Phormidesmis sp. CAN_BIN44]|nr:hypothetical protein [Phormidesmis sp. CAN_BIN44]
MIKNDCPSAVTRGGAIALLMIVKEGTIAQANIEKRSSLRMTVKQGTII